MSTLNLTNEFGESHQNQVGNAQAAANAQPAKAGITAIAAIPTPASATAEDCANKINAILAALKAVS